MREKKKLFIWQIVGTIFTIILGSMLHYTYELSGYNPLVGIISPTSESTVQHLKLLLTPFVIYAIVEYLAYGKGIPYFFIIKAFCVAIGMISIPVIFYTYTWILGRHILWVDIAIFFVSVIIAYSSSYSLLSNSEMQNT